MALCKAAATVKGGGCAGGGPPVCVTLFVLFLLLFFASAGTVCAVETGGAVSGSGGVKEAAPGEQGGQQGKRLERGKGTEGAGVKGGQKVPFVITSDSLVADKGSGTATFKGNVIAEEAFLLCSDELVIAYGTGTEVKEVAATGGVRIIHGTRVAGAERAQYIRADSMLLLTGSARIVECGDVVRGERIELYLNEDRVVVDGGTGGRVRAFIRPEKSCKDSTGAAGTGEGADGKEMDGESRCRWAGQVLR